jgi:hypothetical protein
MFLGFTSHLVESRNGDIFVIQGGPGPPVLLLHGFPETHLMWRAVAPLLAADFSVICADLPGYGRSACPPDEQRTRYSKRSMAEALVEVMAALGHDRFSSPQLSQRMHGRPRAIHASTQLRIVTSVAQSIRVLSRAQITMWSKSVAIRLFGNVLIASASISSSV